MFRILFCVVPRGSIRLWICFCIYIYMYIYIYIYIYIRSLFLQVREFMYLLICSFINTSILSSIWINFNKFICLLTCFWYLWIYFPTIIVIHISYSCLLIPFIICIIGRVTWPKPTSSCRVTRPMNFWSLGFCFRFTHFRNMFVFV